MKRQKKINKMLKHIKCAREVTRWIDNFKFYGLIVKIKHWWCVAVVDRLVPTFSIPTILAKKYLKGWFTITIHKEDW